MLDLYEGIDFRIKRGQFGTLFTETACFLEA